MNSLTGVLCKQPPTFGEQLFRAHVNPWGWYHMEYVLEPLAPDVPFEIVCGATEGRAFEEFDELKAGMQESLDRYRRVRMTVSGARLTVLGVHFHAPRLSSRSCGSFYMIGLLGSLFHEETKDLPADAGERDGD